MAVKVEEGKWSVVFSAEDADVLDDLLRTVQHQRGIGGTSASEIEALDAALDHALSMLDFEQPRGGDEDGEDQ